MLLIGLTGGIGSGKTTISQEFQSRYDCPVIDADDINRQLLDSDVQVRQQIVDYFGEQALSSAGQIDRQYLRQSIFSDDQARTQLEAILHPRVMQTIEQQTQALQAPYALVVIPLLFELNLQKQFDRILVVDCDESCQIYRVSRRDGCDNDAVTRIIQQQSRPETRLSEADDIINNSGDIDELDEQICLLHKKYMELSRQSSHNI